MDQNLATVVLLVASILGFIVYTAPAYVSIEELRLKIDRLSEVAEKAEELGERQSQLEGDHKNYLEVEDDLLSISPVVRDDARTLMEISSIAGDTNVRINDARMVDFSRGARSALERRRGNLSFSAKTIHLEFEATYEDFGRFLTGLERTRRVFDPVRIDFSSSAANVYDYEMRINAYWVQL